MVSKTRKVSFYRLSLEKQTLLPGTRTVRVTQLNNSEIEDCFRGIYNEKMQVLSDNHKAINITASNGHYVIEAISFEEHRAFLKISKILLTLLLCEIEQHWKQKMYQCVKVSCWSFILSALLILRAEL